MTVIEAAEQIGLSPDTVYDLCRLGLLGHRRVGPRRGRIQITPEHVAAYLRKAEQGGGEPTPRSTRPPVRKKVRSGRPDGKPCRWMK
jgi:excisionase family DNA binding protein